MGPAARHVADGIPASAQHQGRQVEGFDKVDARPASHNREVGLAWKVGMAGIAQ